MSYGFVYLMSNESFSGLYKIGHTYKSPYQRASELSSTSTPCDFDVLLYASTESPHDYELALHNTFKDKRVNNNREFFCLSEEDLKEFIKLCECFSLEVVITTQFKKIVSEFIRKEQAK